MAGITSLPHGRAGAKRLLALTRGRWGFENGLDGVRDGTLREDASRIRKGSATQVMAIVRNLVIFEFNQRGYSIAAAATQHYVCDPEETLEIVSTPKRECNSPVHPDLTKIAIDRRLPFDKITSSRRSGRSSAWLERTVRDREVGGSNPLAPTFKSLQGKDLDRSDFVIIGL